MIKEARRYNEEKTVSSINAAGKTGQLHIKKMKLEHSLTSYTKINSKWVKDPNVRQDSIKLLEEILGKTLFDTYHNDIFFDLSPRVMEIKTKINKLDLIKLKSFCSAKEAINKTKRQPTEWENICKCCDQQRINLQNLQAAHAAQYQKKQTTQSKNG